VRTRVAPAVEKSVVEAEEKKKKVEAAPPRIVEPAVKKIAVEAEEAKKKKETVEAEESKKKKEDLLELR
jgi:hypothetical protein